VKPAEVSTLVFVCGPVVGSSKEFNEMISRFSSAKKIAIGVSILPRDSRHYWNPFDVVIPRDGASPAWGDIAPAYTYGRMDAKTETAPREYVGLCLRGQQSEYGKQNCLFNEANQLANALAKKSKLPVQLLDTKLHNDPKRSEQIMEYFGRCKFVITTRMHGGVLALCDGIPALGIDQISGGAKLHAVLSTVGWPYVLKAEDAKLATLEPVINEFMKMPESLVEKISNARANLVRKAQQALEQLPLHFGAG
jgi:hypothetical protein